MILASIIGTVSVIVLAAVAAAVGLTLFFRKNPNKQAEANKVVDSIAKKL